MSKKLEIRVAALEKEIASLKAAMGSATHQRKPWWEQITGVFADDPAFDKAMRLGRRWRNLQDSANHNSRSKRNGGSRH